MNNVTYIHGFETEQEAMQHAKLLINGGIVQKQGSIWHVWQIN